MMILTSTKYSIADLKDTGIYAGKDTFFRFNAKYDLAGSKECIFTSSDT